MDSSRYIFNTDEEQLEKRHDLLYKNSLLHGISRVWSVVHISFLFVIWFTWVGNTMVSVILLRKNCSDSVLPCVQKSVDNRQIIFVLFTTNATRFGCFWQAVAHRVWLLLFLLLLIILLLLQVLKKKQVVFCFLCRSWFWATLILTLSKRVRR